MFAAFPDWYATVFSALYLPLLAILFGDDPAGLSRSNGAARSTTRGGAAGPTSASRSGPGCPRSCGASRSRSWCAGCPSTPTSRCTCPSATCSTLHAARRAGDRRRCSCSTARCSSRSRPTGRCATTRSGSRAVLALPVTVLVGGFGLWTQLAHGKGWTWLVLAVAVVALLTAVVLMWADRRDGWAFVVHDGRGRRGGGPAVRRRCTRTWCRRRSNPDWSLTIYNALVDPVHAEDHDLGGADLRAAGDRLPGMDVLGVPPAHLGRRDPRSDRTVEAPVLTRPTRSPSTRGCGAARRRCAATCSRRWPAAW